MSNDAPAWLPESIAQMESLQRLRDNWDGEGAPAIRPASIQGAAAALQVLAAAGYPKPRVFPGTGGGVLLEWSIGDVSYELQTFYEHKPTQEKKP